MKRMIYLGKGFGFFCTVSFILLTMAGCSGKSTTTTSPEAVNDELAPVATLVESYGDIELPLEMTLIGDKSMALRTDSFQGGIHIYRGNVQIASLKDYIVTSMRNNKWKMVGEASYKSAMLAFTKPNKTCMVILDDNTGITGKTQASFYVTVDVAASSRLNPFGEPIAQ